MDEETWQTMIDVNLTGVWKTIRASVPHVVAGGRGGSVVITSSLAAQKANVETLFGLTSKAFEGVEKLVELNLTASKAALTEAVEFAVARAY